MKNFHYYFIKLLSIVYFIYTLFFIIAAGYLIYLNTELINNMRPVMTQEDFFIFNDVTIYAWLGIFTGIIAIFGSVGLFLFKKWGLYSYLISVLLLWGLSLLRIGGIVEDWYELLPISLVFFYLIIKRGVIFNYKKIY